MKFLVPNYSCLQNPWLGGYRPQIPVLSVLNWICWSPPHPNKIPGYANGFINTGISPPEISLTYKNELSDIIMAIRDKQHVRKNDNSC